jgi:beta-phosphoglucomutase
MIKAVLFDFDGVLFDTEHKRFSDLKAVLKRYELELEDSTYESMLGIKTTEFARKLFPELDKETLTKIAEERRDLQYNELDGNRVIDGVRELLGFLKSKGLKLAVVTGSRRFIVEELLEMHELSSYFEIVITGEDFKSTKPDPECFRMAVESFGFKPEEAIVIDDAAAGVRAAKALGCKAFGLKTYLKGDELDKIADKVFSTLVEIKDYFENGKWG